MDQEVRALVDESIELIDSVSGEIEAVKFLTAFIDSWAFFQTEISPPREPLPSDLNDRAAELHQLLSVAMRLAPASDVLGFVLNHFGYSRKPLNEYPDSPGVAASVMKMTSCDLTNDRQVFHKRSCGTGASTTAWINRFIEQNGEEAFQRMELVLEDVDELMVKACYLQLINYFEYIGTSPSELNLWAIDSATGKGSGIYYRETGSAPEHSFRPESDFLERVILSILM